MAKRKQTLEEKSKAVVGKVYHGIEILKVLKNEPIDANHGSRWFVLAKCVCGREYVGLLTTIQNNPKPSCGCRNSLKGRGVGDKYANKGITAGIALPAPQVAGQSTSTKGKAPKRSSVLCDVQGTRSRMRLVDVWDQLPHEECCPAWKDEPFKFVEWAIRNGFTVDKVLVRRDQQKPFSPMNTKWEMRDER